MYNPPDGFCWDQFCGDPPIKDDPDLEDYNVDDVVMRFLKIAKKQVRDTRPQALLIILYICMYIICI